MLVDRHHVQYLIELGRLAEGKTASQLTAQKSLLDAFLRTLFGAASPRARDAFAHCMARLPIEDRPWSAVRDERDRLTFGADHIASGPPAALLVLDQVDDDPDADEDGNRLPNRIVAAGTPWARLHDALERWDTAELLRWAGPLGWQQPRDTERLPQEAEPCGSPRRSTQTASPARAGAKEPRS